MNDMPLAPKGCIDGLSGEISVIGSIARLYFGGHRARYYRRYSP